VSKPFKITLVGLLVLVVGLLVYFVSAEPPADKRHLWRLEPGALVCKDASDVEKMLVVVDRSGVSIHELATAPYEIAQVRRQLLESGNCILAKGGEEILEPYEQPFSLPELRELEKDSEMPFLLSFPAGVVEEKGPTYNWQLQRYATPLEAKRLR
jgi:hypothetical protein